MRIRKVISCWIQSFFYLIAGANHFVNPSFYTDLIPPFFANAAFINDVASGAEILLGLGLLLHKIRKYAVLGIVLMLIAFIPSHVYFIQLGSCVKGGLCVPEWVGWLRLVIIHPLLMYWAWSVRK